MDRNFVRATDGPAVWCIPGTVRVRGLDGQLVKIDVVQKVRIHRRQRQRPAKNSLHIVQVRVEVEHRASPIVSVGGANVLVDVVVLFDGTGLLGREGELVVEGRAARIPGTQPVGIAGVG